MMGSGKSAVGRALAARWAVPFIDLDARIERMFGMSVAEAFARGEPYFRDLEQQALRTLLAEPAFAARRSVVATGGGAVVDAANRALIDAAGPRVLLHVPPEELARRLVGTEASVRPLVASAADPQLRLAQLWAQRRASYEAGAIVVDGVGAVSQVVDRVLVALDLPPQTGETSDSQT